MEDSEIDATIKSLHEKVNQITTTTSAFVVTRNTSSESIFSGSILKSPIIYYGAVPLTILIILFFWKPSFIMENVSIDGKLPEKKLIYKKLFMSTLIVTIIIAAVFFIYSCKNKKDVETIITT